MAKKHKTYYTWSNRAPAGVVVNTTKTVTEAAKDFRGDPYVNIGALRQLAEDAFRGKIFDSTTKYEAQSVSTIALAAQSHEIIGALNIGALFSADIPFNTDGLKPVIERAFMKFVLHTTLPESAMNIKHGRVAVVFATTGTTFSGGEYASKWPAILDAALDKNYEFHQLGEFVMKPYMAFWNSQGNAQYINTKAELEFDFTPALRKACDLYERSLDQGDVNPLSLVVLEVEGVADNVNIRYNQEVGIYFHYVEKKFKI